MVETNQRDQLMSGKSIKAFAGAGQVYLMSLTGGVSGSIPRSTDHFGGRRQLAAARLVAIRDIVRPCVALYHSQF